ncbi:unnamed protein product [Prunus brigantina]
MYRDLVDVPDSPSLHRNMYIFLLIEMAYLPTPSFFNTCPYFALQAAFLCCRGCLAQCIVAFPFETAWCIDLQHSWLHLSLSYALFFVINIFMRRYRLCWHKQR